MKLHQKIIPFIMLGSMLFTGCTSKLNSTDQINENIDINLEQQDEIVKNQDLEQIYTPSNNTEDVESFKNKNLRKSRKKIGNLKPIKKIAVGRDFLITNIKENNNLEVNDPGAKSLWAISYTNSNQIWNDINQKNTINIAVVDTGVDYTHIDLKNRVKTELGYDFINNDNDPMDDNGHGTHVAGIIAAEMNNNEGIVGVVGNTDVNIIPIKVLDENGVGDLDLVADGIIYAVDKGADIINLSLGGIENDELIKNALNYALDNGVFVVAAAGNDNRNCNKYTPAGIKGVYTVAASNLINKTTKFSNFGTSLDITAPGVKILSTLPNGNYEAWDGTSMAAPVVSGIAAMLIAEEPSINIDQLKEILNMSSKDIMKDNKDILSGFGLIDAKKAFDLLKEKY